MLAFSRIKWFSVSLFCIFSFLFVTNKICEADMDINKKLIEATIAGDISEVKTLIKQGADVNATDNKGYTVFMFARMGWHTEIEKFLIDNGADVNIKNIDEQFLMATFEGDISGVKTFIKQGADINYKDSKLFFNSDKMRITSLSPSAYTALMIASCYGHIEIVKYLIDNGADIDYKTEEGNTALTYALMYRHTEILKFFEDKGADINIDVKQFRMLLVATTWGDLEVVKYLIKNGADVNYKDPHYPHAKGMRITSADSYDYTALMIASRYGYLDIVKYLIDKGADINIKTKNSSTALMFARMYEHTEIEKFLIENGADVNIKNRYQ